MILLRRRDRLGNWLFQYCFARVLAQRFGYRLEVLPVAGFPGSFAELAGEEVYGPEVRWHGQWPYEAYSGRRLVREEFFQRPGQRLMLDGWFQRFELIAAAREEIRRDWLRVDGTLPVRPSGDLAICLRLGADYAQAGSLADSILREEEIRRLARCVPHERLYFVTDAPGHPLLAKLGDLGAEVFAGGGLADFRFIQSFQKIAFCQSTFQWWAAFLSEAREIYFPPCDRGLWSHPEPADLAWQPSHWGIDLRVDEESYIYDW